MKHKQILAFLALALAVGAGSLAVMTTHADEPTAEACNAEAYTNFATALNAGSQEIQLEGTICPTNNIVISRNITIDLNGHDIRSGIAGARVLDVKSGNVTVKGSGSIIATDDNGAAVRVYGAREEGGLSQTTNLTIDSGVNLIGGANSYGLFVSYDTNEPTYGAHGVSVTFKSGSTVLAGNGLFINGMIQHADGPVFNIEDGVEITSGTDGIAIYAAGYGTWNIGQATIKGGTTLGIKSGVVNLKNTTMLATASYTDNVPNSDGMNGNGSTIQIEKNGGYAGGIEITIDGGDYSSNHNAVFTAYDTESAAMTRAIGDDYTIQIKGGTFTSAEGKDVFDGDFSRSNTTITGGSFTSDIKDLLAENLTQDASGAVISGAATVTPNPDDNNPSVPNPTTPDKDHSGSTPDTGVNTGSEVSAVMTLGGLGVGAALLIIVGLIAAIRHPNNRILSIEVTRSPSKSTKKQTAARSSSSRKTASTARQTASRSSSKASVRSSSAKTRKASKTTSKKR